jgi:hypothetical protein
VGGESLPGYFDTLVSWAEQGAGILGRKIRVPAGPEPPEFPAGAGVLAISDGEDGGSTAISKHGGAPGRWLVAWERGVFIFGGFQTDLYARVVNFQGMLCSPVVAVATDGFSSEFDPDCAGDGTHYMLVWSRWGLNDDTRDLRCCTATYLTPPSCGGGLAIGEEHVGITYQPGVVEAVWNPAIDDCGNEFVVCFTVQATYGLGIFDVWVVGVDHDACLGCEPPQLVAADLGDMGASAVAAQRSGSASAGPDVLLAWQAETSGLADIEACFYSCKPGTSQSAGPPCGTSGGVASVSCAAIGNDEFTHRLSGAQPATPALLVVGFSQLNYPCGTCVFVPVLSLVFSVTTDSLGTAAVTTPIPNNTALTGLVLYEQWAVVTGSGACIQAGVDFSNALLVTVGV